MDNQVIFGGQINMQNDMRTIHVGIFHLFQKTKNEKKVLGIKTLILLHLNTETLLLSQTRLSFKNREIANFYKLFLISAINEGSGESVHFRKFDLALKFEK